MSDSPNCPKCHSENTYEDSALWVCPSCFHEWSQAELQDESQEELSPAAVKDAHGGVLNDGDSVVVVKDLKVKGSSSAVKVGTKVKNIRLVESSDGHNIACKIDGFGAMNLKSEFVKKTQ